MCLGLRLLASPRLPAYTDEAVTIEDLASVVYWKGFTRHEKCSYILCIVAPFPSVTCLCLVSDWISMASHGRLAWCYRYTNAYRSWPWHTGCVVGYSYNLIYLTKVPRSSRSSVVSLYSQQKEIGSLRGWFRVNKSHICQDLSWSALNSSLREKKFLKNLESCQKRGGRAQNITVWLRGLDEKKKPKPNPNTKENNKKNYEKTPPQKPPSTSMEFQWQLKPFLLSPLNVLTPNKLL